MNYYDFVSQPRFFSFLLEIDQSIAEEAHDRPCRHCGGRLDRGDFMRAGYGLPAGAGDDLRRRFSLCCREDGCRRRLMPESLRFLRGVGYVTIVVVLLSAIQHGLSAERAAALQANLKVSRQTIRHWLAWWRGDFAVSPFWKARRGRFPPLFDDGRLPLAILAAFAAAHAGGEPAAVAMLRFLAPYHPN